MEVAFISNTEKKILLSVETYRPTFETNKQMTVYYSWLFALPRLEMIKRLPG